MKIVCPIWAFCSRILLQHACQLRILVKRDERSPEFKTNPPYGLYIANHQSVIDIPLISTLYQVPPIMKKEILYIPLFGWLAWLSGAIPVSRKNNHSQNKVFSKTKKRIMDLKLGVQVYPEGTRSRTSEPMAYNGIKKALLIFAFREKIPVIPTSVYGTSKVFNSVGLINFNQQVGIIVHQEMRPEHFKNAEEFSSACWSKVIEGHEQIKKRILSQSEN